MSALTVIGLGIGDLGCYTFGMKTMIFVLVMVGVVLLPWGASAEVTQPTTCRVKICNKLERFTLDLWSHIKDKAGETCFEAVIPKEDAVVGKVLDQQSRWYQGSSINPTKKSVTRVKQVIACAN